MNLRLARLRVVLPLLGGAAFVLGACGGDEASSAPAAPSGGAAGSSGGGTTKGGSAGATAAGAAGATSSKGGASGSTAAGASGSAAGGAAGSSKGGASGTSGGGSAGATGGKKPGAVCAQDNECSLVGIETQPPSCAEAFCDAGLCALRAVDTDGDTFRRKLCKLVSDGSFAIALGGDCDDTNKDVNPKGWDGPEGDGKPNNCGDGVDQDCSGLDGDSVTAAGASCSCVPGDVENCAQTNAGVPIVFPGGSPAPGSICTLGSRTCAKDPTTGGGKWGPCGGAQGPGAEVCNNKDDDCDGSTDEDDAEGKLEWVYDGDSDGFRATTKAGVAFASRLSCTKPAGTPVECDAAYCGAGVDLATCCPPDRWRLANTASANDCDDRDTKVNPAASEVCGDGPADKDENCDGKKNELPAIGAELWFLDSDGDGYGDKFTPPQSSCVAPGPGWLKGLPNTDCDDKVTTTNPGVPENCGTQQDDNCNGTEKDGCDCVKGTSPPLNCGVPTDCAFVAGGSICGDDGKYSACPAIIPKKRYCPDADNDTYCDRSDAACVEACPEKSAGSTASLPPASGFIERSICPEKTDCADNDGARSPGKPELCGDADGNKDADCDPTASADNGFDLGTTCDVGSGVGACKGAGSRVCSGPQTTTCAAPASPAIPSSVYHTGASPAPTSSFDWNCDGKLDRIVLLLKKANLEPPGEQALVIEEAPQVIAPPAGTPPLPAPWTSTTSLHPTPDGLKYRPRVCGDAGNQNDCKSYMWFTNCSEPSGQTFSSFTCNEPCGKAISRIACKWVPATGKCVDAMTLSTPAIGCR